MKNILIILFLNLVLFACTTSNSDNKLPKKTDVPSNQQSQKKTAVKEKLDKVNFKKPAKAIPNNNYHQKLKQALNLNNLQINKLKGISKKYNKKLKSIPKNKAELIKKTKAQKQQEIKKMLGEQLYLKKIAFDKQL